MPIVHGTRFRMASLRRRFASCSLDKRAAVQGCSSFRPQLVLRVGLEVTWRHFVPSCPSSCRHLLGSFRTIGAAPVVPECSCQDGRRQRRPIISEKAHYTSHIVQRGRISHLHLSAFSGIAIGAKGRTVHVGNIEAVLALLLDTNRGTKWLISNIGLSI